MKNLKPWIGIALFALTVGTAWADNGIGGVDYLDQLDGYVTFSGWACTLVDFSPPNPNKHIRIIQEATGRVWWEGTMLGTYYPNSPSQCIGYPETGWGWTIRGIWPTGYYSFEYEETYGRSWNRIGTLYVYRETCSPICP